MIELYDYNKVIYKNVEDVVKNKKRSNKSSRERKVKVFLECIANGTKFDDGIKFNEVDVNFNCKDKIFAWLLSEVVSNNAGLKIDILHFKDDYIDRCPDIVSFADHLIDQVFTVFNLSEGEFADRFTDEERFILVMDFFTTNNIPKPNQRLSFCDISNFKVFDYSSVGKWIQYQLFYNYSLFKEMLINNKDKYTVSYQKLVYLCQNSTYTSWVPYERLLEVFLSYINHCDIPYFFEEIRFCDIDKNICCDDNIIDWFYVGLVYDKRYSEKVIDSYFENRDMYLKRYPNGCAKMDREIELVKIRKDNKVLSDIVAAAVFMKYYEKLRKWDDGRLCFSFVYAGTSDNRSLKNWMMEQFKNKNFSIFGIYRDVCPWAFEMVSELYSNYELLVIKENANLVSVNCYGVSGVVKNEGVIKKDKLTLDERIVAVLKYITFNDCSKIFCKNSSIRFCHISEETIDTSLVEFWFKNFVKTNEVKKIESYRDEYPEGYEKLKYQIKRYCFGKASYEDRVRLFMRYINDNEIPLLACRKNNWVDVTFESIADEVEEIYDTCIVSSWLTIQLNNNLCHFLQEASKYKDIYPNAYRRLDNKIKNSSRSYAKRLQIVREELVNELGLISGGFKTRTLR